MNTPSTMTHDPNLRIPLTEFQCLICKDLFNSPCTLPCGHTFCKQCIFAMRNVAVTEGNLLYSMVATNARGPTSLAMGNLRSRGLPRRNLFSSLAGMVSAQNGAARTSQNSQSSTTAGEGSQQAPQLDIPSPTTANSAVSTPISPISPPSSIVPHGALRCPLCRQTHHINPEWLSTNILIQNLIHSYALKERSTAALAAEAPTVASSAQPSLGLFLMRDDIPLLPGRDLLLFIFEPKYRNLLRSSLAEKRFGIVSLSSSEYTKIWESEQTGADEIEAKQIWREQVGVVACIEEAHFVPNGNGRAYLRVIGKERFRIVKDEISLLDEGYYSASVEWVHDAESTSIDSTNDNESAKLEDETEPESAPSPKRQTHSAGSAKALQESCISLLQDYFEYFNIDAKRRQIFFDRYGNIPTDVSQFSFWISGFISLSTPEKRKILHMSSSQERLEFLQPIMRAKLESWKVWHWRKKVFIYVTTTLVLGFIAWQVVRFILRSLGW